MSIENETSVEMDNPIGNIEPPRSRKKFWIFGGLGCFGLLALVCGGGTALVYWVGVKPALDFQAENINSAMAMPEVEEVLGTPITAGTAKQVNAEEQKFNFRVPLSGPKGEGVLVFGGKLEGTAWTKEYMYLEVGDQEIDLDAEAMFDIDVSEGE